MLAPVCRVPSYMTSTVGFWCSVDRCAFLWLPCADFCCVLCWLLGPYAFTAKLRSLTERNQVAHYSTAVPLAAESKGIFLRAAAVRGKGALREVLQRSEERQSAGFSKGNRSTVPHRPVLSCSLRTAEKPNSRRARRSFADVASGRGGVEEC